MNPAAPTAKYILTELITKLKNSGDYKTVLKRFKEFMDKKDCSTNPINYFLYFDLDMLEFKIGSEFDIPYNTLVLVMGVVPSKKSKEEKRIEYYQFTLESKKK